MLQVYKGGRRLVYNLISSSACVVGNINAAKLAVNKWKDLFLLWFTHGFTVCVLIYISFPVSLHQFAWKCHLGVICMDFDVNNVCCFDWMEYFTKKNSLHGVFQIYKGGWCIVYNLISLSVCLVGYINAARVAVNIWNDCFVLCFTLCSTVGVLIYICFPSSLHQFAYTFNVDIIYMDFNVNKVVVSIGWDSICTPKTSCLRSQSAPHVSMI